MRVLVCGSRSWTDYSAVASRLANIPESRPTIIHGGARGADMLADRAARTLGFPVLVYKADWQREGRQAGFNRNIRMLDAGKPDLVIAFWDGTSRGTQHTINEAIARHIPVEVIERKEPA